MKRFSFTNLLFNLLVAVLFMAAGLPALPAVGAAAIGGHLMSYADLSGSARDGLLKEVWTNVLLEGFYPDTSFINEGRDMSSLVEYNKINLAEAGANPTVLIDNTSYPIAVSSRTDVPKELALKTLDTTSTVVGNIEAMELAYDKMASVVFGHRAALQKKAGALAAWNWAPASNGTYTPVIAATGTLTGGYKKLTFADVLNLMLAFNKADISPDGRVLVLNPQHEADLIAADLAQYKTAMQGGMLFGFKLYRTTLTPTYNASTGAKVAFGAEAAVTDTIASFAFQKDEVMKAMGSIDVFAKYKDPDYKGDIINFQMRFCALQLRTKGVGAIYSPLS